MGNNMQVTKVPGGNNKHKVLMYAISTCGWCKRAKKMLNDMDVEYEYIDIDLCSREDKAGHYKARRTPPLPHNNHKRQNIVD